MALAVMTVGAMGIFAMQQASTKGVTHARKMSRATQINRTWLQRVRRDALAWRTAGAAGVAGTDILSSAPATPATPGDWFRPVLGTAPFDTTEFAAQDFQGAEAAPNANSMFCTEVRLNWVTPAQTAMRVDVRTWWRKTGSSDTGTVNLQQFGSCSNPAAVTAELATQVNRLHAVYNSTVVRRNLAP